MNNQDLEQQIGTVVKGMDELQVQTEDPSEAGPRNFSMLPVKLQSRIFVEFMLAVKGREKKLVALTSISRLWRTTILNTPVLWRRLVISDTTTREKVDTWLQRAGGTFSSLLFVKGYDFDARFEMFGGTSANIWSSLEHLEIQSYIPHANLLPPTVYKELRLRSLKLDITIDYPSTTFWYLLWTIDVSRMRKFQIETNFVPIPMAGSRFTALFTLRLSCRIKDSDLLAVLERNPMLEELALSDILPGFLGSSRRVELVNLTKLELSESSTESVEVILQCLILPNLKVLRLIFCTIRSSGTIRIENMLLTHSIISSTDLITLLRNSCALRELAFVKPKTLDRDAMDLVLEALASPIPSELEGTPLTLCCPQLQHVDLIGVPEIITESAMRVVKARLPSIGSATTSENSAVKPLPIVHLMLDKCPTVDRESLPWFEANVPEFTYRDKRRRSRRA